MTASKLIHNWLRDAHGMEKALGDYIQKSIKDFDTDEAVQSRLQEIHAQTSAGVETIERLLKERDDSPSTGKDFIGNLLGFISGTGSSAYHDDTVKNVLVIHSIFHFAHGCYVSLSEGAQICDDKELAETCSRLADERRLVAEWAEDLISSMTERALLE